MTSSNWTSDIPNMNQRGVSGASALRNFCSQKLAFLVLAVSMAESTAKLSSEVDEKLSSSSETSEDERIVRGTLL